MFLPLCGLFTAYAFGTRYVTPKAPATKKNTSAPEPGPGLAPGQGLGPGGNIAMTVIGSGAGSGSGSGSGSGQGAIADVEAGQKQGLGLGPAIALGYNSGDYDDPLHFDDDGGGMGDGTSICVDEGYGHDALDHYDYDALDQVLS